ncbi:MAG: hypothetical protein FWD68_22015, partial [Alphaproteobacteria bacterium]|nr:hypothetical protein [Alphaproteobacteria bacterium]
AGTSELAWSAYKFGTSSDQNETWQHSFNENKENKEAGDRLHPWASWCGTAGGVAAFVGIGVGAAALKGGTAVVAGAAEAAVARGGTAVATEAVEGAIAKGTTAIAGRVAGEGAVAVVGDAAAGAAGRGVAEGAADAAVGAAGKGVAKDVVGEGAATAGERVVGEAAGKGAAEAAGIAAGNTGRMSSTTFNALLGAVFGGVGGASNNADTLGHALAGGTIGAGLGAAVGAGVSKAVEVAVPAVSRFVSETVSGKRLSPERLSPERLSLEQLESIWGAGPPKKGDPPFVAPQYSTAPESVANDAAQRLAASGAGQGAANAATGKPVSGAANTVSEALAKGGGKVEKPVTNDPQVAGKVAKAKQVPEAKPWVISNAQINRVGKEPVSLSDEEIRQGFEKLVGYRKSLLRFPDKFTGDRKIDQVTARLETSKGSYDGHSGWIGSRAKEAAVKAAQKDAGFKPNWYTPGHGEGHVFHQALENKDFGGIARLFVDSEFCKPCGIYKGVENMRKAMGYGKLEVFERMSDGSIRARVLPEN